MQQSNFTSIGLSFLNYGFDSKQIALASNLNYLHKIKNRTKILKKDIAIDSGILPDNFSRSVFHLKQRTNQEVVFNQKGKVIKSIALLKIDNNAKKEMHAQVPNYFINHNVLSSKEIALYAYLCANNKSWNGSAYSLFQKYNQYVLRNNFQNLKLSYAYLIIILKKLENLKLIVTTKTHHYDQVKKYSFYSYSQIKIIIDIHQLYESENSEVKRPSEKGSITSSSHLVKKKTITQKEANELDQIFNQLNNI